MEFYERNDKNRKKIVSVLQHQASGYWLPMPGGSMPAPRCSQAAPSGTTIFVVVVVLRSGAWRPTCIGPMQSFKHVLVLF